MNQDATKIPSWGTPMRTGVLLLIATLALLPMTAGAATQFAGLTYNYSFPAVDLDGFVSQDSWYGATLDLRRAVTSNPNFLLGISSGWYVFYNNINRLIEFDNGAVSGEQYRNFNIVPILASANYMLGQAGQPRAYLGLHVGAYYARQQLDIGLYSFTESNWHFGLAPEAGVTFPAQRDVNFYFNARYHYLFNAGDYLGGQSLELPFFTLGVGFAWSYY